MFIELRRLPIVSYQFQNAPLEEPLSFGAKVSALSGLPVLCRESGSHDFFVVGGLVVVLVGFLEDFVYFGLSLGSFMVLEVPWRVMGSS